jgi:MYXO-CTERM domain-containing protein
VAGSANAAITSPVTIDNFGVSITGQGDGAFTTPNNITGPFTRRSAYNTSGALIVGDSSISGTGAGFASLSVAQDADLLRGAALFYYTGSLDLSLPGSSFQLTISNLTNPGTTRIGLAVNNFNSGAGAALTVAANGVLTFSRASIEAAMLPGATNWSAITSVKVYFYGAGGGSGTSTFDVSNFQAVPAPGAVALLGAAGVVGMRRRRN